MNITKNREDNKRFNATDHTGDIICFIDTDSGDLLDVNEAAESELGYSREELLGMNIKDIEATMPIQTPEQWSEHVKKIKASDKPLVLCGKHRHKDGRDILVEVSFKYHETSLVNYIVAVARDISERERLKKLAENQQKQLIHADKMISLGTMAAGVAHEVNNPLSVAAGDIHMLKRDVSDLTCFLNKILKQPFPPEISDAIDKLKKEMDISYITENFNKKISRCAEALGRIEEIVRDLKDFSYADKGDLVDFDINKGIESTLQLIPKKYKRDKEINKKLEPLPTIPCYGRQLNQVFMNIMVNALQAMKGGGTLTIATSSNGTHFNIKISDNGPGIPENKIKKIFEPFYTTKPIGEGTGLGLSISHSIIKKHRGEIAVVNNPDKGVTFTIKLFKDGLKMP